MGFFLPEYITAPLIGGFIGAGTNWLAIKALFRPLEKKFIFGIPLPLTPGVIPSGRERIAKSVGEVVGSDLLNEDVLQKLLLSDEVLNALRVFIDESIRRVQETEKTVGDLAARWAGSGFEAISETAPAWISSQVISLLRNEKTRDAIQRAVAQRLDRVLDAKVSVALESDGFSQVRLALREVLRGLMETGQAEEYVLPFLLQKIEQAETSAASLREMLPESIQSGIRRTIEGEAPRLAETVSGYLESERVRYMLQDRINRFIEGFGPLEQILARFADKKYDFAGILVNNVRGFLKDPHNQTELADKVANGFDRLLDSSMADICRYVGSDNLKSAAEFVTARIANGENAEALVDAADRFVGRYKDQSWREVAATASITDERIHSHLGGMIQRLVESESTEQTVEKMVRTMWSELLALRPSDHVRRIKANQVLWVKDRAISVYTGLIEKYVGRALSYLPIAQSVEEHLNSLDLQEIEKMILQVVSKELKMITYLGFVLGALVGGLLPFLG